VQHSPSLSCELRTATGRGLLRLEAEAAWAALAQQLQLPLTIFRLGGEIAFERALPSFTATHGMNGNGAGLGNQLQLPLTIYRV
jgi:hypothetical protein